MGKLQMLDVSKMQRQVIDIIERNKLCAAQVDISDDKQTITVQNGSFSHKIIINSKWIGYDFSINQSLTGGIPVGDSLDTDLYPLDYDEQVSKEIFNKQVAFLENLLNNTFYYGYLDKWAVFAKPSDRVGYYDVKLFSKGLLGKGILAKIKREIWPTQKVEFTKGIYKLIVDTP